MSIKGQYKKHNNFDDSKKLEIQNDIEMINITRDRSYMVKLRKKLKSELDPYGIYKYINFVETFIKFHLSNTKIIQFLNGFAVFYNSLVNIDQKIEWLKPRIPKQSNFCEKNLIFTTLAHKYKSKLLEYLDIYISAEITEVEKRNQFIDEFKNKILLVENQAQNIDNTDSFIEEKVVTVEKCLNDDYFDSGYFDDDTPDEMLQNFFDYYF